MALSGQFVTVVNRTTRELYAKWDGKDFVIPVGESTMPLEVVPYAKRQNPILGTMHPQNPKSVQFKLGVKGTKDPINPIVEDPNEIELIDRSKLPELPPGQRYVRIRGREVTRWEIAEDNPVVDNQAAVGGD